ncbi:MAG: hypothetical protein WAU70_00795 [Flavobacteriales bacterium]
MLKVLLIWTSLTTLIFWLPTVRGAFDGEGYVWGVLGLAGRGIDRSYWFPFLGSLLSIAMLRLGWRGGRLPFKLLLGGWHLFLSIGITAVVLQDPDGFHVQGDTMGMDIDLAVVGPVFFGLWAVLTLCWILRDGRRGASAPVPPWTRGNTRWLLVLLLLLPIQYVLLHNGAPESREDQVGVLLTVAQWLLLGVVFAPRTAKTGDPAI